MSNDNLIERDARDSKAVKWLLMVIFCTSAYHFTAISWNQISRLNTVYSFVEPGTQDSYTLHTNRFITDPKKAINTGDWAFYDGNYYTNKHPGASLFAIPLYFGLYYSELLGGADPTSVFWVQLNSYVLNLFVSVLPLTVLAWVFFWYSRQAESLGGSLIRTAVLACGTLLMPFSTSFWGHVLAATTLFMGFAVLQGDSKSRAPFIGGFILGCAVLVEYTAAAGVVVITLWYVLQPRKISKIFALVAGGVLPLVVILCYQKICFGGFLTHPLSMSNPVFGGEAEFNSFDFSILAKLLFSDARGLFVYMPVLLLAPLGFASLWRRGRKADSLCFLGVGISAVILIAAFGGWHAGSSAGPRYLIYSLPFWCLLLPPVFEGQRLLKGLYGVLAGISILKMLLITCVTTLLSPSLVDPFTNGIWIPFLSGKFPAVGFLPHLLISKGYSYYPMATFNIGQLMGLKSHVSLLPWLLIVIVGVHQIMRILNGSAKDSDLNANLKDIL